MYPKVPTLAIAPQEEGENPTGVLYLDRPTESGRVLLKVVPIIQDPDHSCSIR